MSQHHRDYCGHPTAMKPGSSRHRECNDCDCVCPERFSAEPPQRFGQMHVDDTANEKPCVEYAINRGNEAPPEVRVSSTKWVGMERRRRQVGWVTRERMVICNASASHASFVDCALEPIKIHYRSFVRSTRCRSENRFATRNDINATSIEKW